MAALRYFISLFMIPISFLMLVAGIAAYRAGEISPNESGFLILAGFALPLIILVNLIIAIFWMISKKWWAILPLSAIILNTGYILSIFQLTFSSPEIPSNTEPLRVASYNVGKFRSWEGNNTQAPVARYLLNNRINIACLQEYMEREPLNTDSLANILHLPYHAVEYLPGSISRGSAIFSKFPIINFGSLSFNSDSNDAMWADILIGKQIVRVINCHLQTTNFSKKQKEINRDKSDSPDLEQITNAFQDIVNELKNNSRIRALQADIVKNLIDTTRYPIILCGDFNDLPSSYTYHHIKGDLKDCFRSRGQGYGYTFRGLHHLLRIDYIFYSSAFKCTDYQSSEQVWSDHNPVITELFL